MGTVTLLIILNLIYVKCSSYQIHKAFSCYTYSSFFIVVINRSCWDLKRTLVNFRLFSKNNCQKIMFTYTPTIHLLMIEIRIQNKYLVSNFMIFRVSSLCYLMQRECGACYSFASFCCLLYLTFLYHFPQKSWTGERKKEIICNNLYNTPYHKCVKWFMILVIY